MIRPRCSIIIPVKPVGIGKSRLRSTIADASPAGASLAVVDDLVAAIALDTIAAALTATGSVLVITDDSTVSTAALRLGAQVAPDAPDAGLNAAIAYGDALLPPSTTRAALTADLPALRPAELAAALTAFASQAAGPRAYVADHVGTGTTMLIAWLGVPLDPHFGGSSAAAHAASGALALTGDWPSLRLDVDTRADLTAARALGLGPRTTQALAAG